MVCPSRYLGMKRVILALSIVVGAALLRIISLRDERSQSIRRPFIFVANKTQLNTPHSINIQRSYTRIYPIDEEDLALNDGIPPRIFRTWPQHRDLPCFDDQMQYDQMHFKYSRAPGSFRKRENIQRGFLYMRPPKCASTTTAGVNMRIARNVLQREMVKKKPSITLRENFNTTNFTSTQIPMCDLSFSHGGRLKGRRFKDRILDESFLWTIIREPTSRHVSFFWFWGVSALHKNTSDADFQRFLKKQPQEYYFTHLSPRFNVSKWKMGDRMEIKSSMTLQDKIDEATYILNAYDFIGVVERFDESLVVLGLLLNVPLSDLLYYSAKTSDNFYVDPKTKNLCLVLQRSVVSEGMREFFAGDYWKERIYSDAILHRAAERSLDMTIDRLGRETVQNNVKKLQDAQRHVIQQCRGQVRMECEKSGEPPNKEFNCIQHDIGCGMDCLDAVASDLHLNY